MKTNDTMKKAIRYLRFSSDDQSQHSIERQELVTGSWLKSNDVLLIDSWKDEGYSARNFDRPDVKKLFEFIKKNYRNIDYLVVAELTRFSRVAGDAINIVMKIQEDYNIKIVSAGRSAIYDCHDSNSFFMMGIEFLLGNADNIKRTSDINGGIYAAKASAGKWIQGGAAPFGYTKQRDAKSTWLIINPEQAAVVRFIYDQYLADVPVYLIRQQAKQQGFNRKGTSCVQDILSNPLYMSFQNVKPWKDQPGGLFPIKDLAPIIDTITWYRVQEKIAGPKYKKTIIDDLPLRGLLRCYCSKRVSGAPSTNKIGKKYLYYKCAKSRHLNLSATKAHDQLQQILQLLSLPDYMITEIRRQSNTLMKEKIKVNQGQLIIAKNEMNKIAADLHSIEKKFISEGSITTETYHRWHQQLTNRRIEVGAQIEKFSREEQQTWFLLDNELDKLSDLQYLYNGIATTDKQELLKQVFDDSLYYQNSSYRTPYIMETFSHNLLTLKHKQLLIIDGADYSNASSPVMWRSPSHNRTLTDLLSFIHRLRVA